MVWDNVQKELVLYVFFFEQRIYEGVKEASVEENQRCETHDSTHWTMGKVVITHGNHDLGGY